MRGAWYSKHHDRWIELDSTKLLRKQYIENYMNDSNGDLLLNLSRSIIEITF